MAGIPLVTLGGYPGAPPNPGGGARGGNRGCVSGVPPVAGGPGVGPPPPPNIDHLPLWICSGAIRGVHLAPLSVPEDEGSLGKYLWDVSMTSKETDIVSDLDAFRTK